MCKVKPTGAARLEESSKGVMTVDRDGAWKRSHAPQEKPVILQIVHSDLEESKHVGKQGKAGWLLLNWARSRNWLFGRMDMFDETAPCNCSFNRLNLQGSGKAKVGRIRKEKGANR